MLYQKKKKNKRNANKSMTEIIMRWNILVAFWRIPEKFVSFVWTCVHSSPTLGFVFHLFFTLGWFYNIKKTLHRDRDETLLIWWCRCWLFGSCFRAFNILRHSCSRSSVIVWSGSNGLNLRFGFLSRSKWDKYFISEMK